ncbi:hypothetical protein PCYB_005470, partial [Plasmodium cynomolgi strain B]
YPLLEEILNWYDILDQSVDKNIDILNLCDETTKFINDVEIIVCKKILRKLFLCNDPNNNDSIKCCNDLHFWFYFKNKKYSLSNGIIKKIFELPNKSVNNQLKKEYCSPDMPLFVNFHKPEELIKLIIFNENKDKFLNLLNNMDYSKKCSFKRYFYDCVNTYHDLNEQYCSKEKRDLDSNKGTCEILDSFIDLYNPFFQVAKSGGYVLPNLSSSKSNDAFSCTPVETKLESFSTAFNNSDKLTTHSIPTAIGTMAGIPPFLWLIYRRYHIICT